MLPSKASLDAAFPNRPVALYSGDAHTLWLNSCALRELGISRESVPPAGGSYDVDEEGELTGIVREAAAMALMPRIMATFSDEEILGAYQGFLARLASLGITSICDMALSAEPGLDFVRDDIYRTLEGRGQLTCRAHLFPTLTRDVSRFESMRDELRGPLVQARGIQTILRRRFEPAYRLARPNPTPMRISKAIAGVPPWTPRLCAIT